MAVKLPKSESRRVYHKQLVREMQLTCGIDGPQARRVVDTFLAFLQKKVKVGETIDMGFISLTAVPLKPATYVTRFQSKKKEVHLVGQTIRWKVNVRKGWLKKAQALWSHR